MFDIEKQDLENKIKQLMTKVEDLEKHNVENEVSSVLVDHL